MFVNLLSPAAPCVSWAKGVQKEMLRKVIFSPIFPISRTEFFRSSSLVRLLLPSWIDPRVETENR
jgi:hypothetical protein